jgi:ABC-type glycerol-3-phosphate transport system substrate-binding protein
MQSKTRIIIALITCAVLLAGCTQQNNNTPNPGTTEKVLLKWVGAIHSKEVMDPIIKEYTDQNPNVEITYETLDWDNTKPAAEAASNYLKQLKDDLNQGVNQTADIFTIDSTWVGLFEKYLAAAPADVYTPDKFKSTFWPAVSTNFVVTNPQTQAQSVLGVPDYIDVLGIVYNNDFLSAYNPAQRIPAGWSEFRELARGMTLRGTGSAITQAGFAGGFGKNVEFSPELFNLLMVQNGTDMVDNQGLPTFGSSDNLSFSESAFNFYRSFINGNDKTWVDDEEYYRNDSAAFIEQQVAMIAVPSWRYRQLLKINDDADLDIDIKAAKIPQLAGDAGDKYWATYFGNVVAKDRPYADEAWRFLSWLTQPDQLRKIHNNTKDKQGYFGTLYPRQDMLGELTSDPYLSVYNEMLPNAITWPMVDGLQVRSLFRELLNANGGESAITSLESRIKALVNNKSNLISGQ